MQLAEERTEWDRRMRRDVISNCRVGEPGRDQCVVVSVASTRLAARQTLKPSVRFDRAEVLCFLVPGSRHCDVGKACWSGTGRCRKP